MGGGNAQCGPGLNNLPSPPPTGMPKRRITAFSWVPTVKNPEKRKTTTRPIMMTLMMAKLRCNASERACVPASSAASGVGEVGAGLPPSGSGPGGGWSRESLMAGQRSRMAAPGFLRPKQIERRALLIEDQGGSALEELFQGLEFEQED